MINIKYLDPSNIKIIEKYSYLQHWLCNVTPNSVKSLQLINKINGYIQYLAFVHTDKSKDALKKYEELSKKIKILDQMQIAQKIMIKDKQNQIQFR